MNYSVYKHTFPNGKVYIGITSKKPEYRWNGGRGYKGQRLMYNAILKYGWDNVAHEILYNNLSKEEAEKKEIELIKQHKSNQREYGYNIDSGGNGVGKMSEETRYKISQANKGEKNWFYGKKHTEEARQKMKDNHPDLSGANSVLSKSILQYDINGNFIAKWDCITTAALALNIDRHMISKCLNEKQVTTHRGKYIWFNEDGFTYEKVIEIIKKIKEIKRARRERMLLDNPFKNKSHSRVTKQKLKESKKDKMKHVFCAEEYIVYESVMEAERKTGINSGGISNVCLHKQKSAGKHPITGKPLHWYYVYDQTRKDGTLIPGAISLGIITQKEVDKQLTL